MLNKIREGYTIKVKLPEECGHSDYYIRCTYKYNKKKEKYSLSMWLMRDDIDDTFKIDSQEIDKQYISSSKERIEDDICRIIEYASLSGFFEKYINRYEYTYRCFDIGDSSMTNVVNG